MKGWRLALPLVTTLLALEGRALGDGYYNLNSFWQGRTQAIFATDGVYFGFFGGVYFADFACQSEAHAAGLGGTWKAVISDDATAATSRVVVLDLFNTGAQRVTSFGGLWSAAFLNPITYDAGGATTASPRAWTGNPSTGVNSVGNTCASWTSTASGQSAYAGNPTATIGNALGAGPFTCNSQYGFYCVNLQLPSATPPDPAAFSAATTGPGSVGLTWSSSGGTTAAYQISYRSGATAPADCNSGTVVPAYTIGTGNPTTYTVTGLSSSTQYSFRLCAMNSDLSASSGGVTLTATTTASGTTLGTTQQFIFTSSDMFYGNFGGLPFADFICQNDAHAAGLSGTWKAVLSDASTAANGRLAVSQDVFNVNVAGIQRIAPAGNFWNGTPTAIPGYVATGTLAAATSVWTGSADSGAINANTCASWTSSLSTVNGFRGVNNSTTNNLIGRTTQSCNTLLPLYCIDQQSAAATPPDPTSFAAALTQTTSVSLTWSSGGGTTAAYQMAYQAGATPPATCNAGTVLTAYAIGVPSPTTYTVTGLSAGTEYSFRLCAMNSDLSASSPGVTLTVTTPASGAVYGTTEQLLFVSAKTFYGDFGGLSFADFICQSDAHGAGLGGTWKAVLSDAATAASSRLTIGGDVFNTNIAGLQRVAPGGSFWSGTPAALVNYVSTGTAATQVLAWTGSSSTGAINASTCSSWTSAAPTASGERGNDNVLTAGQIAQNTSTCNTANAVYCINQQSSAAAPPDPTGLAAALVGASLVSLTWSSGGGTTAAYQLSYQAGATAPATCNAGTVVSAYTLGVPDPTTYTVTGLSSGTQYSFRLCAMNADLTASSAGQTLTVTTSASGTTFGASQQLMFVSANSYAGNFGGLPFADFICQSDAHGAGFGGTWKAVLSDGTTAAASRLTITADLFNTNAAGVSRIVPAGNFWSGTTTAVGYKASGASSPTVNVWTGSTSTGGIQAGLNCSNWTTNSNGASGYFGNTTGGAVLVTSNSGTCDLTKGFYCTNQQSSAASPADPATFTTGTVGTTSIGFTWSSGGGTTAAYQLAYQIGSTPPADCDSGTVVSAYAIGTVNPTSYTVTGLTTATHYAFRLCAENSDLSAASPGLTLSVVTN